MKTEVEKGGEKEVAKIRGGIRVAEKRLSIINETKRLSWDQQTGWHVS